MRSFKDGEGREWLLKVNVLTLERVDALAKVDLLAPFKTGSDGAWTRDIRKSCEVLWAVCQPEAEERKVTREQFLKSLAGDVINQGLSELTPEIIAFFPDAAERAILERMFASARAADTKRLELIRAKLAETTVAQDSDALLTILQTATPEQTPERTPEPDGTSSIAVPESAELTLVP